MLRKVYQAQKDDQTKGDFADLVTKDLLSLNIMYEEVTSDTLNNASATVQQCNNETMQQCNNASAQRVAYKSLQNLLSTHTKVKTIKYQNLELQE